jgi:quinate/shikimate dehydrogenase (NAD+)
MLQRTAATPRPKARRKTGPGRSPGPRPRTRKNDPERTRRDIIAVATEEFASHGYSGARVDAIAARTRTSKRMIYYYFGGKEPLYLAVLEEAYRSIRNLESNLDVGKYGARDALRRLVEATFDHDEQNPNFIRLVSIENIHRGRHMKRSAPLRALNSTIIATLRLILERGRKEGVFRRDVDAIDLHLAISSYCFFRVANRYTFGTLFDRDLNNPRVRNRNKQQIGDMVLAYLAEEGGADRTATGTPPQPSARPGVLTGLIGAPIAHSASPAMHEAAASRLGLRGHYQLIEVAGAGRAELRELLAGVRRLGFAGVNVTYPYKEAVVDLLDELAPEAAAMGAVNTVVVRDGALIGHNTDTTGFARAAAEMVAPTRDGAVAVIGAGGVGKAIAFALVSLGVAPIRIFDTDRSRTERLAKLLRAHDGVIVADSVEDAVRGAAGLVNATPVGMLPSRDTPVPAALLHERLWVADAIYSPLWTPLLTAAKAAGARVMTGRELAIYQAADAFKLFTGLSPSVAVMGEAFDGVMANRRAASPVT